MAMTDDMRGLMAAHKAMLKAARGFAEVWEMFQRGDASEIELAHAESALDVAALNYAEAKGRV